MESSMSAEEKSDINEERSPSKDDQVEKVVNENGDAKGNNTVVIDKEETKSSSRSKQEESEKEGVDARQSDAAVIDDTKSDIQTVKTMQEGAERTDDAGGKPDIDKTGHQSDETERQSILTNNCQFHHKDLEDSKETNANKEANSKEETLCVGSEEQKNDDKMSPKDGDTGANDKDGNSKVAITTLHAKAEDEEQENQGTEAIEMELFEGKLENGVSVHWTETWTVQVIQTAKADENDIDDEETCCTKFMYFYLPIAMNTIDFGLCILSYFTAFQKVECCGVDDSLWRVPQILLTTLFLFFVGLDLYLIITRREHILTVFNPLFGYVITYIMAASASKWESVLSLCLTLISQLAAIWVTIALWLKFKKKDSPTMLVRLKFYFEVFVGLLAFVGAAYLGNFLIHIYEAGGVCIQRNALGFFQIASNPRYCWICPGGSPANADLEFWDTRTENDLDYCELEDDYDDLEDAFYDPIYSNCTCQESYGTYCGLNSGMGEGENKQDFCFREYDWGKLSCVESHSLADFSNVCLVNDAKEGCASCNTEYYPLITIENNDCSVCCWGEETSKTDCTDWSWLGDSIDCSKKAFCKDGVEIKVDNIFGYAKYSIFAGSGSVKAKGGLSNSIFINGSNYEISCNDIFSLNDCDHIHLAGGGTFECSSTCRELYLYGTFTGRINKEYLDELSYYAPTKLTPCNNETLTGPCCGDENAECEYLGGFPNYY